MTLIGAGGGDAILIVVIVLLLIGVVYGFYTRSGSGIEPRPWDGSGGAPGAKGQGEVTGQDEGEGAAFDTHGTR